MIVDRFHMQESSGYTSQARLQTKIGRKAHLGVLYLFKQRFEHLLYTAYI